MYLSTYQFTDQLTIGLAVWENSKDLHHSPVSVGNYMYFSTHYSPDSKVHGANMGPTWVLSALDGPHVGPMNLAIREAISIEMAVIYLTYFGVPQV